MLAALHQGQAAGGLSHLLHGLLALQLPMLLSHEIALHQSIQAGLLRLLLKSHSNAQSQELEQGYMSHQTC